MRFACLLQRGSGNHRRQRSLDLFTRIEFLWGRRCSRSYCSGDRCPGRAVLAGGAGGRAQLFSLDRPCGVAGDVVVGSRGQLVGRQSPAVAARGDWPARRGGSGIPPVLVRGAVALSGAGRFGRRQQARPCGRSAAGFRARDGYARYLGVAVRLGAPNPLCSTAPVPVASDPAGRVDSCRVRCAFADPGYDDLRTVGLPLPNYVRL